MVEQTRWDLAFVRVAVAELQEYLLSNTLYWQVNPPDVPRSFSGSFPLTPGNLLLSMARLDALAEGEQAAAYRELQHQFISLQRRWRANWGKKVDQEFTARLTLWKNSLKEEMNSSSYPQQVKWRVLLQLLWNERLDPRPEETEELFALDQLLRNKTVSAPFVWDAELAGSFAREIYWFLYTAPAR